MYLICVPLWRSGVGLHLLPCLRQAPFFLVRQATGQWASLGSPVSVFHLSISTMGLQMCADMPSTIRALEIQTQVLRPVKQAFAHPASSRISAPWALKDGYSEVTQNSHDAVGPLGMEQI